MKAKYHSRKIVFLITFAIFANSISSDDATARAVFEEAFTKEQKSEFASAAEKYMDAQFLADDKVLKINALQKAAENFRKAKLLYKEFTAIEKLLRNYPSEVNFDELVSRQYEIGGLFYAGKREPALSWMPWIKDEDKSLEIYEAVRKHAPFAKFAPQLKFRLGVLYLEQGKIEQAIEVFEEINTYHKDTPEEKFAIFELANIYLKKASKGDGDGSWGRKARATLRKIIEKYPDDKDTIWAREELKTADTLNAKKAFAIADFYRKQENYEAAARYYNDLITEYPKTDIAKEAEEKLAEMGRTYREPPIKPEHPQYAEKTFKINPMSPENKKYIEVPESSDGKWLLPIQDLELDKLKQNKEEKQLPE